MPLYENLNSALGMIEVKGMIGSIVGADAALKAANVHLASVVIVKGGITTVKIYGEVAAVKAALDAAQAAIQAIGIEVIVHVIPRLCEEASMMEGIWQLTRESEDEGPVAAGSRVERGDGIPFADSRQQAAAAEEAPEGRSVREDAPATVEAARDEDRVELKKMTMQELRAYARKIGVPDAKVRLAHKQELLDLTNSFIKKH